MEIPPTPITAAMRTHHAKLSLVASFAIAGSSLLAISSASAADYTWGGGNLLWNNTTASGWNGGPPASTDTATINSGTVTFAASDTYGQASNTSSAAITVNTGGTLASGGKFNSLWNLSLGGGTLFSNGGVNAAFGTFNLAGTVTASGGVTSSISTGAGSNNLINLGNGSTSALTNTTFNVGAAGTLNVGTVLQNHWYWSGGNQVSTAGLIKNGDGQLNLNATNTYTGGTTINLGTLTLGHATNTLSDTGAVNVNGGTLALGTNTDTVGAVTLTSGSITGTGAGKLTGTGSAFDVRSGTISAKLGGTVGLTKTTAGTVTISSDNSTGGYSGATNVNVGTLIINGNISTSSLTTVAVGATLGGSGTVGKTVVNGTLSVGNSPGQMNFTDTVSLAGSTIMEIDGNSGAGATGGHDFVNLTGAGAAGALTYGGTMTLDMGTIFGAGTYTWNLFDMASETGTFTSITLADQYSGSLLDADLNGVWDLTSGSNTWQFTESTGVLGLTVVPEPRTALLGSLGLFALLRRRRYSHLTPAPVNPSKLTP